VVDVRLNLCQCGTELWVCELVNWNNQNRQRGGKTDPNWEVWRSNTGRKVVGATSSEEFSSYITAMSSEFVLFIIADKGQQLVVWRGFHECSEAGDQDVISDPGRLW